MIETSSTSIQTKKIKQHAVLVRRKVTAIVAFTTTIFLLCIENVKAFTAPLSSSSIMNENTIMFLATGAHSIAKRWKMKGGPMTMRVATSKLSNSLHNAQVAFIPHPIYKAQLTSITSLKMAFGFGDTTPSAPAPPMLDMKTSINAFGGWYNSMDPVARPPVYDDEMTEYSFSSPADSWPSSFEDDASTMNSIPNSFSAISPASTAHNLSIRKSKRPRPIQTLRKIAGWVFRSPVGRSARGFGTQSFL